MSDLDKIKDILFGNEKKALDAITRRLDTPDSRADDVADVLPDAINRSYTRDPRLRASLRQPLEESLSDAIRREPQRFADALFPVMGPAIRRAIAEALKSWVQSMNRAIDTSLSPNARYRAWRAGVPLGEWVLRQSLVYRVDEVYLIDPDSGLLIEHVRHGDAAHKDEDAVSAMLTAIQDFVRDSFTGSDGALSSADIGDCTVWVTHGPRAMLAAVIRGTPSRALREVLDTTIERVHLNHGRALKYFDGDPIAGIDAELEACLQYELRSDDQRQGGFRISWPLRLVLLALLAVFAWWSYSEWQSQRRLQAFENAVAAGTGLVLTDVTRSGSRVYARGLRDPLGDDAAALAAAAGIAAQDLTLDLRPYQSLEPALVARRARTALQAPDGVELAVSGGVLTASGEAGADWVARARALAPAIAGVERADFSAVLPDDAALLQRVRDALQPPDGVLLALRAGELTGRGSAPQRWLDAAPARLASVDGLRGFSFAGVAVAERARVRELASRIEGSEFYFPYLDEMADGDAARVAELAVRLRELAAPAATLGLQPRVMLTGFTDGIGSASQNLDIQLRRARALQDALAVLGVERGWLEVRGSGATSGGDGPDLARRKVEVGLTLTDASGQRWE